MNDGRSNCQYKRAFQAKDYLKQYYSTSELCSDDVHIFREFLALLRRLPGPVESALDFGCGPVLHYAFAMSPFAERLELAEYLPDNRQELQMWWENDAHAHDWNPLFSRVLEEEGSDATDLAPRQELLRRRLLRIQACDLRQENPLGEPRQFDLVTSFFCSECVAVDRDEWERMLGKILDLVAPGGTFFLTACREATHYNVLGQHFPIVPVTERDISRVVLEHGFEPESLISMAVPSPAWQHDGFDQIALVAATKQLNKA